MLSTFVTSVVPEPTWNVAPLATCTSAFLINATFPDVASDSIVSDVPAPTSNFLGVLKTLKSGDD